MEREETAKGSAHLTGTHARADLVIYKRKGDRKVVLLWCFLFCVANNLHLLVVLF